MFLMPMFDPRSSILGLPANVVIMLAAIGMLVVGFLWIRHVIEPEPFLRGESRWRYRERGRVDRIRRMIHSLIAWPRSRTSGWWATRLEFGLAGAMLVLATAALQVGLSNRGIHGPSTPAILATSGVGYAGMLIGIRWMRRIYLAPLETDRAVGWRYRDR